MNNTQATPLNTFKPSEVYGATIALLKQRMGMRDGHFINKARTHIMTEVGDYHSDWEEKVRALTDEEKPIVAQIDALEALRAEAQLNEAEHALLALQSKTKSAQERVDALRKRASDKVVEDWTIAV